MRFLRRSAALVTLIATEGVAVVAVHRLGEHAPFDLPFNRLDPWLHAAPADALAAGLRAASLLCAWWLLLVTLVYACACACASCVPSAVRACEWATPRAIRRTVDRALAASIVAGAVTVPFGARLVGRTADGPRAGAPPPSVIVDVRDGRSRDSLPANTAPPPARGVPDASPESPPSRSAPPDAAGSAPNVLPVDQRTVVVATGDNLWDLSAAALARATARERATLGNDEIARYWSVVCDANRATVRSGDVNLISPGEVIVLPSVQ